MVAGSPETASPAAVPPPDDSPHLNRVGGGGARPGRWLDGREIVWKSYRKLGAPDGRQGPAVQGPAPAEYGVHGGGTV
ncbi:hypothetical protein KSP39_PZI001106 [Platanthera zijinensis]|uniref:Uncharacterized protein n=1 Tax=Platanthera zijinensis TaxID=2320716 RepID=A0AAP0GFG9_9ASPA